MTRLDVQAVTRLIKLLGMCGSNHAGERSVAALKADKLVRACGLTWHDVVRAPMSRAKAADSAREWHKMRNFCLQHGALLRAREQEFLVSLGQWRGDLTEKQHAWLAAIFDRVQRAAA